MFLEAKRVRKNKYGGKKENGSSRVGSTTTTTSLPPPLSPLEEREGGVGS